MFKFFFIGWCQEDTHDKIWVVLELGNNIWGVIWGRRGKSLQYKMHNNTDYCTILALTRQKQRKGYQEIPQAKLDTVYPEFQQDLEKTAFWMTLSAS